METGGVSRWHAMPRRPREVTNDTARCINTYDRGRAGRGAGQTEHAGAAAAGEILFKAAVESFGIYDSSCHTITLFHRSSGAGAALEQTVALSIVYTHTTHILAPTGHSTVSYQKYKHKRKT